MSEEKIRICNKYFPSKGRISGSSSDEEPQDADYSYVPSLGDELEFTILARVPRSVYWKYSLVNKRYLNLLKSGMLFEIRKEIGFKESSVLMLASGETCWWAFDREFASRQRLPVVPSDSCFTSGDKESLCAGTHLIISGMEIDGPVIWRYELGMNNWFKGPSMINPRCLFASATCGSFACVAGGIDLGPGRKVLNTAEKYNPETKSWDQLPLMNEKRKLCSGCFMDNKFYVIGGKNEAEDELSCAEVYDEDKSTWTLIPNMLENFPVSTSQSPPLVAVVNNELYLLEISSNEVKLYLKQSNSWRKLGPIPVRTDFNKGWGVAFKSLGDELLVIGASSISIAGHGMSIYTCCPHPDAEALQWMPIGSGRNRLSHFILNCSVMVA